MASSTSFLDLTSALIHDQGAKSVFADDPEGYLARSGFADFTPADVTTALEHAADALPAAVAVKLAAPAVSDGADGDDAGPDAIISRLTAVAAIDADEAAIEWAADHPELVGEQDPGTLDFFDEADSYSGPADTDLLGDDPESIDELNDFADSSDELIDTDSGRSDPDPAVDDQDYGEGGHDQAPPTAPEESSLDIEPAGIGEIDEPGIDEVDTGLPPPSKDDDPIDPHDPSAEFNPDPQVDEIDGPE